MNTTAQRTLSFLCFMLLMTVGACVNNARSPEVVAALEDMNKLKTAAKVGVNRAQYSSLVIEAQSSVNEALKKLSDGELKTEMRAAMEAYSDASIAWAKFDGEESLNLQSNADILPLKHKYKVKSMTNGEILSRLKEEERDQVFEEGTVFERVTRASMLNAIWQTASRHLDHAEALSK
jgi:hypothetical protein